MRALQIAALVVIIGGLVVLIGSFSIRGACPSEPCGADGGLFHMYERTGVEFGPGIVTAFLGAALIGLGGVATRDVGRLAPVVGVVAAAGVLTTVVIHLVIVYSGENKIVFGSPYLGLYTTVIGGLVSMVASVRLWQLRKPPMPARDVVDGPQG